VLFVDGYQVLVDLGIGGLVAVGGPQDANEADIVMGLFSDADGVLEPDCAPLLNTLVDVAAIVMSSADVARGTAARHLAALEALCRALDARTHATKHHHARVAKAATAIAVGLGLPPERVALITQAALIHDVGLIAATGDGTIAAEFAHPAVGADMASLVPGAAELAPIIRAHHEWWDGFGFPNGLLGEAIPLEARVLAAAEFYIETLQAGPSWDADALAGETQARSGGQLDPACARQLVDLIQEP
jgi:HD-GYP domain-containing protein (c-di-GMP phosphodiesterase class II)